MMTVREEVIVVAAKSFAEQYPEPSFHDWEIVELVEDRTGLVLSGDERVAAVEAFDAASA